MGRGRGKGKKQSPIVHEDSAIFEDEKSPMKRRGRPQKQMKDEIEDNGEFKMIQRDEQDRQNGDNTKSSEADRNSKNGANMENSKKRKRATPEDGNLVVIGTKTNANVLITNVGYRHNESRRKNNKPRRAAEVGVECK